VVQVVQVFQGVEELQVEVVQVKVNQHQVLVHLTQVEVVEVLMLRYCWKSWRFRNCNNKIQI
jgi:hypothetical protein